MLVQTTIVGLFAISLTGCTKEGLRDRSSYVSQFVQVNSGGGGAASVNEERRGYFKVVSVDYPSQQLPELELLNQNNESTSTKYQADDDAKFEAAGVEDDDMVSLTYTYNPLQNGDHVISVNNVVKIKDASGFLEDDDPEPSFFFQDEDDDIGESW